MYRYGAVGEDGAVEVEVIYEPEQDGTEDAFTAGLVYELNAVDR